MERFAKFIVHHRKMVLVIAVILLIPSVFGAVGTYINYDILTYLPAQLDSMIGEQYLEDDFHMASTAMITVEHMGTADLLKMKDEIAQIPGVEDVLWTSDLVDVQIPREMLPEDIQKFFYNESGATMMIVRFYGTSASEETMNAIEQIKSVLREDCFIGGMSAILADTKALINSEIPLYVLCAVACSIVVLFLSLKGTVVPAIFMVGIAFPIVYNFGTNYFLGQISYITEALATVLQLGVTMDFSIFLLHRYEEEKRRLGNGEGGVAVREIEEQAMVKAICNTASSIAGSSLTTIAGFLAMCTMSLALGKDIGIVMAKGVALGVICTVTILPALILTFRKAISKYTHRTFIPKLSKTASFVTKHYLPILLVFVLIFIPFAIGQSKTSVYYTLFDSLPQDMDGIVGTNRLKEDFDMTTTHFIMVDEGLSNYDMTQLTNELEQVDGINQVMSYEKFVGGGIPDSMLPDEVREIFHAGGHRMLLANSSYESGSDEQNHQLEELNAIVKRYDPVGVISGEGAMTKDLIEVAATDFRNVNFTSILAVFIIIAVVFRSASIPVLLVAAIESAIFINLGIPYFTGSVLPFVASIVIGTIQLGATVDYAILLTTRFREELENGHRTREAVRISVEQCSPSILTSGLSFFVATASVALISKMELIKSLCLLISRGALISMAVILLILPALLIVFAPLIQRTTSRWPRQTKGV
ncbi:RND family transporter [uncultured Ruthenibacterium sp.]|uniref:efflux RND transporter permease subunit n=1 Tax=uncultured Ruthenibacterium sp. TaxID=1905347 RepID=UPI00349E4A14